MNITSFFSSWNLNPWYIFMNNYLSSFNSYCYSHCIPLWLYRLCFVSIKSVLFCTVSLTLVLLHTLFCFHCFSRSKTVVMCILTWCHQNILDLWLLIAFICNISIELWSNLIRIHLHGFVVQAYICTTPVSGSIGC